jgi:transmembrane sensor
VGGEQGKDRVIDEAAAWFAALDARTADPAAFEAWRDADPVHAVAFAQVARTWESLERLPSSAVSARPEPTLTEPARAEVPTSMSRRSLLRMGVALAAVGVVGVGGFYAQSSQARTFAETGVGGRRTETLPDGSRIDLNTDSRVAWRQGESHRQFWMERGEASLHVMSPDMRLIGPAGEAGLAQGRYNLRLREKLLDLLVLDGLATVEGQPPLTAGFAILVGSPRARPRAIPQATLDQMLAWQKGELVFNGERLDAVVEEYNRYLSRKLVIGDAAIAGFRLGGRFATGNPDLFLQALHATFGVNARTEADQMILTR